MLNAIKSNWRLAACAFGLGLVLLLLHGLTGAPEGESYKFNLPWFDAFRNSFWAGDLYPRFLPDLWYGMGGYDFFFYAPMPFWLSAVLGEATCPGCDSGTVFALGGAWMIILSGGTFFLFARRFFETRWAGVGGIVYAVLPYHYLIDWFDRQAVGEVAAMVFLPLIALSMIRLIEEKKGGALFALSFAALALSHLPTTLIALHLLAGIGIWLLIRESEWRGRLELIARFTVWGGLGVALSAFYWMPALGLLSSVSPDMLATDFYTPTAWLFLDGRPEISPERALIMKWALALVVVVAGASAMILRSASLQGKAAPPALIVWIIGPSVFAFFFMTVFSYPIWDIWILNRVQFPWRSLVVADLSIALGAVVIMRSLFRNQGGGEIMKHRILAALCSIVLGFTLLAQAPKVTGAVQAGQALSGTFKPVGTPEYVPPQFLQPALERFRATVTDADTGDDRYDLFFAEMERSIAAAFNALQADAPGAVLIALPHDRVRLQVDLAQAAEVRVPLLAWPYWRAVKEQGEALTLGVDAELGIVSVSLPEGPSTVEFHIAETVPQKIGSTISLLAFLLLIIGSAFGTHQRNSRAEKPLATSPR